MKIKFITKTLISIALIAFGVSCTFNEPVLPSWITRWALPIPTVEFEMSEVIDDDVIIPDTLENGTPTMVISIKDSLEKQGISEKDMSFIPDPDDFSSGFKEIRVKSPGRRYTSPVSIEDLLGFPLQPGTTINVPETNISLPPLYVDFERFKYLKIETGALFPRFNNNTFLRIKDSMSIAIFDDSTGNSIGDSYFPAIDSVSIADALQEIDLNDKVISNHLRIEFQMPIEGENGHLVTSKDTQGFIQLSVLITELTVSEAKAKIPEQTSFSNSAISLEEEENRIRYARLEGGKLNLQIQNQLSIDAKVTINLLNFRDDGDEAFRKVLNITANSTQNEELVLNDYYIKNHLFPNDYIDSLRYTLDVETDSSDGFVVISKTDSVFAFLNADTLFFSEFSGFLDTVDVEFDEIRQEDIIDYGGLEGGVRLEGMQMIFKLYNEAGIPIDVNLNIKGQKFDPDTGALLDELQLNPIQVNIAGGSSGNPAITEYVLSSDDPSPNIVDLIAILPSHITVTGNAQLFGEGMLTVADSIWAEYEVTSPFILTFTDTIPAFKTEIDTLEDLSKEFRETVEKNVQDAYMYLDVINGLPVNARVQLHIATDTTGLYTEDIPDSTQKIIIRGFSVQAGEEGADGFVENPAMHPLEVILDPGQINIFTHSRLFIGAKVFMLDNNKEIRFRSNDSFEANGYLRFNVLVND